MHGLIHNLTVVEQLADNGENSGKYEVVAGGRRLAALQRLAKQKKVPKTFAVPCHVVDAATATETSLAENIIRVAMHPADQFNAFHDLVVQSGLSIDDVAARFGVSPLFVRQRLKHANVAFSQQSCHQGPFDLPSFRLERISLVRNGKPDFYGTQQPPDRRL